MEKCIHVCNLFPPNSSFLRDSPCSYRDYRGLERLIKAVEVSRKGYDIHLPDIRPPSYIAEPRPSEVDPHADERSLEGSESGSQCPRLPPLNFSVLDLAIERGPYNLGTERRQSSSIPSRDPMDPSSFDKSCSLWGIKVPGRSEPRPWQSLQYWSYPIAQSNDARHFMDPLVELPLHEILAQLTPQELSFFSMLDAQLNKVESFYLAREKEMVARSFLLINQLEYLKDHREVFLVCHFLLVFTTRWIINITMANFRETIPKNGGLQTLAWVAWGAKSGSAKRSLTTRKDKFSRWYWALWVPSIPSSTETWSLLGFVMFQAAPGDRCNTTSQCSNSLFMPALPHGFISPTDDKSKPTDDKSKPEVTHLSMSPNDPSSYIPAKRKLKKAVSEHYRLVKVMVLCPSLFSRMFCILEAWKRYNSIA